MKKRIALIDFDGTITTKDSLLEFIKFSRGRIRFYVGFILNSPFLIACKLNIISNQAAKEMILRFFFAGMSYVQFDKLCAVFYKERLQDLIRPKALLEIDRLKKDKVEIVVVSASPQFYIQYLTDDWQIGLISTKLEIQNGRITGKIDGKNCNGAEKILRIRASYDLNSYDEILAYGDSDGDKYMFESANARFYKPFR